MKIFIMPNMNSHPSIENWVFVIKTPIVSTSPIKNQHREEHASVFFCLKHLLAQSFVDGKQVPSPPVDKKSSIDGRSFVLVEKTYIHQQCTLYFFPPLIGGSICIPENNTIPLFLPNQPCHIPNVSVASSTEREITI